MMQIYQNSNPLNLVDGFLKVMDVIIERGLVINRTTSETH